jgi:two-component system, NtrC family, nitrogen regulation response regulator NtrX
MARVLIVDDETNIRRLLSGVLADEGYATDDAASAEAALAYLNAHPEACDAVLLDLALPGMDGLTALAAIRTLPAPPVVLVMSGHGTRETAFQCAKNGAFDYIEKPIAAEKLLISLERALQWRRDQAEKAELVERLGARQQLLGESEPMRELMQEIRKAGASQARILIAGENGTGKELVARAIHDTSRRAGGPFVRVNCAAIPRDLIESELFGHERGAFTGAVAQKRGKFELANRGTLFLDEIGDMSVDTQAKLLRVLEENEMERVGGVEPIPLDVRVVAATNKDLAREIDRGHFREDLYFRLAVITIHVPPLRTRGPDIVSLAENFLGRYCEENGRPPQRLTPEGAALLSQYAWPGNVRELRNMMERVVIMLDDERVDAVHLRPLLLVRRPEDAPAGGNLRTSLENYERALLERALAAANHNIAQAARDLGLDRANLHRKLRRYGMLGADSEE